MLLVSALSAGVFGCGAAKPGVSVDAAADAPASAVVDGGAADGGGADGTPPLTPMIPGFDLRVREGSWWLFAAMCEYTGKGGYHFDFRFTLTLGAPVTLAGSSDVAYPVTITRSTTPRPGVRQEGRVRQVRLVRGGPDPVSDDVNDPKTVKTLFDPVTNKWANDGQGLFGNLNPGKQVYSSGPAPLVQENFKYLKGMTAWRAPGCRTSAATTVRCCPASAPSATAIPGRSPTLAPTTSGRAWGPSPATRAAVTWGA